MSCKVIATGSLGNAVLYHNSILVDIGIPFAKIEPYLCSIQMILLTHKHLDHLNIGALRKIQFERPGIRIGCCSWMVDKLDGIKNVDVYLIGQTYNYGSFQISPFKLYHDVPNCGYRIFKDDYKIIHATDTCHMQGIEAKGYDLYAIEHSYDEDVIKEQIAYKEARGMFCYEKGAINSHLSDQQAQEFIFKNKGEKYEVVRLHESSKNH